MYPAGGDENGALDPPLSEAALELLRAHIPKDSTVYVFPPVYVFPRVDGEVAADRPAERQQIIKDRLGTPLRAISRDELTAMLRRYNPAI